mgnify:CR=1 FL=1
MAKRIMVNLTERAKLLMTTFAPNLKIKNSRTKTMAAPPAKRGSPSAFWRNFSKGTEVLASLPPLSKTAYLVATTAAMNADSCVTTLDRRDQNPLSSSLLISSYVRSKASTTYAAGPSLSPPQVQIGWNGPNIRMDDIDGVFNITQ